jgi:hypothetical protein
MARIKETYKAKSTIENILLLDEKCMYCGDIVEGPMDPDMKKIYDEMCSLCKSMAGQAFRVKDELTSKLWIVFVISENNGWFHVLHNSTTNDGSSVIGLKYVHLNDIKKMTERFRAMYDMDPDRVISGVKCASECILSELPKQNEN